jgi:hypothetical protein
MKASVMFVVFQYSIKSHEFAIPCNDTMVDGDQQLANATFIFITVACNERTKGVLENGLHSGQYVDHRFVAVINGTGMSVRNVCIVY